MTQPALNTHRPVKWWHEAIVDDMLAFPTDTLKQRSARLNYTVSWLSIVINSDAFKAMYEQRRANFKERLDSSIAHKTAEVANRALDALLETMEKKRDKLPFEALTDLTDRTLERLGYGVKPKTSAPQVNVSIGLPPVSREQLEAARSALRSSEAARVIEHEPIKQITDSQLPSKPGNDVSGEGV